jgi:hypothetical protein
MVARRNLLPPYMQVPVWQELADSVDEVWGASVDAQINAFGRIRETILTNSNVESDVQARHLIDEAKYDTFDPNTEMLRLNLLGLPLTAPGFLSTEDLSRLNKNVGLFWYSKGLGNFIDFIGYCLNVAAGMQNLWTEDYINFLPEGDPGVGTPIWESGGTWYPTTHVQIKFDPSKYINFPAAAMVQLFYDVSNYNLILHAMISDTSIPITGPQVVMGLVSQNIQVFPGNVMPIVQGPLINMIEYSVTEQFIGSV